MYGVKSDRDAGTVAEFNVKFTSLTAYLLLREFLMIV